MDALPEHKRPDVLAESILRAAGMSVDDLKSLETVFRDLAASFAATSLPKAAHAELAADDDNADRPNENAACPWASWY